MTCLGGSPSVDRHRPCIAADSLRVRCGERGQLAVIRAAQDALRLIQNKPPAGCMLLGPGVFLDAGWPLGSGRLWGQAAWPGAGLGSGRAPSGRSRLWAGSGRAWVWAFLALGVLPPWACTWVRAGPWVQMGRAWADSGCSATVGESECPGLGGAVLSSQLFTTRGDTRWALGGCHLPEDRAEAALKKSRSWTSCPRRAAAGR